MSILCLFAILAKAQLPGTEVWLFDIMDGKGTVSLENGRNISNHSGYDNQPSFSEDGKGMFFTAAQADGQTETMYFDLDSSKTERLTYTAESEYSPRGTNKNTFQCVRVDKDSTQRIYSYKLPFSPTLLYRNVDSVGYFAIADWVAVYFKITNPPTIWLADDGKKFMLSPNPGRCIKTSPDKKKIWFTINTNGTHLLMHSEGKKILLQATLPDSAEFFDFWDEESIVISAKTGLHLFNFITKSQTQIPLPEGILLQNITRLAISPDKKRLALVAND